MTDLDPAKKVEYRFELGDIGFSVKATSEEEEAHRMANEFVGSLPEFIELDSLESKTVFNVVLYPHYTNGPYLTDIEEIND